MCCVGQQYWLGESLFFTQKMSHMATSQRRMSQTSQYLHHHIVWCTLPWNTSYRCTRIMKCAEKPVLICHFFPSSFAHTPILLLGVTTTAPSQQRRPKSIGWVVLGSRQTMARTPLEPLSQDDNYGETVANPLISLRGETAAPIRRETSDRACGPRPESEPQQGELQFYLNLASQPCDYLRVQRNEVVQRSLGESQPVKTSVLD